MSAPASQPAHGQRPALWWLPSDGWGNGLTDTGWAPVLEVAASMVAPLLEAFRAAGVPAYAAPMHPAGVRLARRKAAASCRVWVGTSAYGRAEDVLLAVMPGLRGTSR